MQLLGHRYYDSSTGRFLTRDIVKEGRNWYTYSANNPVGRSDPSGGGGDLYNPGQFPPTWSEDKIKHLIADIATDPSIPVQVQGNRLVSEVFVSGMKIRVVVDAGGIITAYPV